MKTTYNLLAFARDLWGHLLYYGLDSYNKPDKDGYIDLGGVLDTAIIPTPIEALSLREIRNARVKAQPTVYDLIRTYGPGTISISVPDSTWELLRNRLMWLSHINPNELADLTYEEKTPAFAYANDRKILDNFFGCGGPSGSTGEERIPAAAGRDVFDLRATDYIVELLRQAKTNHKAYVEQTQTTGDVFIS